MKNGEEYTLCEWAFMFQGCTTREASLYNESQHCLQAMQTESCLLILYNTKKVAEYTNT
jgi:hypothetical protein